VNPDAHELAPLLVDLGTAGIELATRGDRLRHRPATLPPGLSARLRLNCAAVVALLRAGYAPDASGAGGEAVYVYGERLGIADGLGMPTHPGSPAWLVAVGESMGNSCRQATRGVHSMHGATDQGNIGSGAGERSDALRDRQGRGRGPQSTVAADERRTRAEHGHDRTAGRVSRAADHDRTQDQGQG
jgi:hypothetical protein